MLLSGRPRSTTKVQCSPDSCCQDESGSDRGQFGITGPLTLEGKRNFNSLSTALRQVGKSALVYRFINNTLLCRKSW